MQENREHTDEVIAKLAHKLRTPITEIKWNANALLEDTTNPLNPEHRHSIELLLQSAERLVQAVDSVAPLQAQG